MIVDIGGGTTEVAVISLGGIVASQSVRVAGDELDDAIIQFIKKEYSLALGERTAEEIKIALGSAWPLQEELTAEIRGRDLVTGLPKTIAITTEEIREAIEEPVVGHRRRREGHPRQDAARAGRRHHGAGHHAHRRAARCSPASTPAWSTRPACPSTSPPNPLQSVAIGSGQALEEFDALRGRAVPWPGSLTGWGPALGSHVVIPAFLQGRRGIIAALVVTSLVLITLDLRGSSMLDGARSVSVDVHRAGPGRDRARCSRRCGGRGTASSTTRRSRRRTTGCVSSVERAGGRLDRGGGPDPRLRGAAGLQQPARALRHPRGARRGDRRPAPELRAADGRDQPGLEQGHPGRHGGHHPGRPRRAHPPGLGRTARSCGCMTDPEFNAGVKVAPAPVPVPTEPPATAAPPAEPAPPTPRPPVAAAAADDRRADHDRGAAAGHRRRRRRPSPGTSSGGSSRAPASGGSRPSALVDLDVQVNEGDPVVTSGIRESLFPPDIPVGRVAEVKRTPGSLQLDVRVEPAADLNHLQFVAGASATCLRSPFGGGARRHPRQPLGPGRPSSSSWPWPSRRASWPLPALRRHP